MLVLIMQFLWKYLEDLIGKGLEFNVLAELFFYVSLTIVPLALPLAILLSSIMAFGNLGEHYELVALKSAGLSLYKIMRPMLYFICFLSVSAFLFSNNILPYANLKMHSLIFDVMHQKPAIQIKEGAFYNGIAKFVIRVEKKDADGQTLHGVMIYDHSQGMGNTRVVIAEKGNMQISEDKNWFVISLENGSSYDELMNVPNKENHPLIRTTFKEKKIKINLTDFAFKRTDEDLFRSNYEMLNLNQINDEKDSLIADRDSQIVSYKKTMNQRFFSKQSYMRNAKKDAVINQPELNTNPIKLVRGFGKLLNTNDTARKETDTKSIVSKAALVDAALNIARSAKEETQRCIKDMENIHNPLKQLDIVWHKKFTLSMACLVLFFIGAPLGAIIRKGGLGMPVVVSVIFFIVYWVISISGEKATKEGVFPAYIGMWISTALLLPLGVYLTRKATADSALFDLDAYLQPIKKVFIKKSKSI
jgi:lipopolysaccharide export system permease protein